MQFYTLLCCLGIDSDVSVSVCICCSEMAGTYMIRVHYAGELYTIPNVKSNRYTHDKLLADVISYALDSVADNENLCISMR